MILLPLISIRLEVIERDFKVIAHLKGDIPPCILL